MATTATPDASHVLPAAGRVGESPDCPYELAEQGARWWRWVWSTPQATKWNGGDLYHIARRAQLEDDVAALGFAEDLDLCDLLAGVADREAVQRVEWALTMLKRAASGKLAIEKEMRELETRLGLNPLGMAALGWVIGTVVEKKDGLDELTAKRRARRSATA
jgi:hypothetical protein